jgi:hypothetical protein
MLKLTLGSVALLALTPVAFAGPVNTVRITEFMSEGQGLTGPGSGANRQREFFELTNLGPAPVDISAWSYNDDNPNDPHLFGALFGVIQAGESIILTQMTAADFRTYWNLPASVRIYSFGNTSNLGNADTINIYNSSVQNASTLVDSLTYTADARGSGVSRNRPQDGGTGQFPNSAWVISAVGDTYGSRLAPNPIFPPGLEYVDLANPWVYVNAVPAPSSLVLAGLALAGCVARRRWWPGRG